MTLHSVVHVICLLVIGFNSVRLRQWRKHSYEWRDIAKKAIALTNDQREQLDRAMTIAKKFEKQLDIARIACYLAVEGHTGGEAAYVMYMTKARLMYTQGYRVVAALGLYKLMQIEKVQA